MVKLMPASVVQTKLGYESYMIVLTGLGLPQPLAQFLATIISTIPAIVGTLGNTVVDSDFVNSLPTYTLKDFVIGLITGFALVFNLVTAIPLLLPLAPILLLVSFIVDGIGGLVLGVLVDIFHMDPL